MIARGSDGNKVDGAPTANRHHSYLQQAIESMIRETASEIMVMQGSLEEGEKRNGGLQVSLAHESMVSSTRESTVEKTCAACAMEWSIQLEKALRSSKPGVPGQSILQLGPRLQQWSGELESGIASNAIFGLVPGEVRLFANAILLRLADAFRGGDKEMKLSVVRAFFFERKHRDIGKHKQCKGLLSKARVANHLELLKRVKYVFDNGDLESKALALFLFGCWADFANDNAQIRYLILSSLVSPHDCEVKASLFAAGCFSEISDDFACITVEMLFNMMNSSTVSLPLKLATAQVFAKLKCSFSVANKAYKAGLKLALNSPDEDILVAMLFSLSELSSVFSLLASNQVDFLLSFLNRERTSRVQETALRCLRFLSRKGLCQYPPEHLSSIEKLCHQTSMSS